MYFIDCFRYSFEMGQQAMSGFLRLILKEITSSLPGRRKPNSFETPDDPLDYFSNEIYTGSSNSGSYLRIWERFTGVVLWSLWLGLGFYFWWFTEVPIRDYIIGTILWGTIFAFTVVGIPITRAVLKHRAA